MQLCRPTYIHYTFFGPDHLQGCKGCTWRRLNDAVLYWGTVGTGTVEVGVTVFSSRRLVR